MPKRALNAIWPRLSGPEVLQPNIAVGIRDQLKGQPKGPAEGASESLGVATRVSSVSVVVSAPALASTGTIV